LATGFSTTSRFDSFFYIDVVGRHEFLPCLLMAQYNTGFKSGIFIVRLPATACEKFVHIVTAHCIEALDAH
jgi:hypothetical protein